MRSTVFGVSLPLTIAAAALLVNRHLIPVTAQAPARFPGPTSSQPLALSADDSLLAVANPDNNTVTFFDTKNNYARLAEVAVGKEPNGVALSPDGTRARMWPIPWTAQYPCWASIAALRTMQQC